MRRTKNLIALVAAGLLAGTAASQAQLVERVGITNQVWKYLADNSDQYVNNFQSTAFDDSTWPSGRGLFGNDTGYPYPFVTTVGGGAAAVTTYYRTHFNWSGSTSGAILTMTNFVDDAVVIFLNGAEITRWNYTGTPAHGVTPTGTANPGGEPVRIIHQLSMDGLTNGTANPLVAGDNVLAVSIHQNASGSSDSVFGLSVHSSQLVGPCQVAVSPASTNAIQCRTVTLRYVAPADCGIPTPSAQWYHVVGGVEQAIAGATGNSLTLTNVQSSDSGDYFVRLSNAGGTRDSLRSTVNVAADTQGPRVVRFVGSAAAANEWIVTYDEAVAPLGGGDDFFTWQIESTDGAAFSVQAAVLQANGVDVILTTAESRIPGKSYRYSQVQDITDACAGQITTAGTLSGDVLLDTVLYTADDVNLTWRYDDTAVDRGTDWKNVGYDDSTWKTGKGVFDGKDTPRTVVSGLNVGTQLQRRVVGTPFETVNLPTIYFRTLIDIPANAAGVTVRTVADDAYVLYVNGTEVSRLRVAAANDGFATYSGGGTVGDANFEGTVTIPMSLINVGAPNTFAALLKQNDGTSSDITWGLEVRALVTGITVVPPAIVTQPVSETVTEGHTMSLSVTASGTSPTYQWYKGTPPTGTEIAGATSATYSKLATAADAGSYYAVASNPGGNAISSVATVTIRPVVVTYGATWSYETNSQDATLTGGTPWYATAFDASAWPTGPGPFARETTAGTLARFPVQPATQLPAPSASFLTAYFRTRVTVPALTAGQQLVLTHLVDDGAAIYIDGTLAYRYNLTNDLPILSTALTPGAAPGDGEAAVVSIPVSLSAGQHTIAVEVHQNSATSSDVVFGAELRILSGAAPALTITNPTATTVQVTWAANPLYSLYSAATVDGVYTPVAGNPQGSFSATSTTGNQFYQLRFNGQ